MVIWRLLSEFSYWECLVSGAISVSGRGNRWTFSASPRRCLGWFRQTPRNFINFVSLHKKCYDAKGGINSYHHINLPSSSWINDVSWWGIFGMIIQSFKTHDANEKRAAASLEIVLRNSFPKFLTEGVTNSILGRSSWAQEFFWNNSPTYIPRKLTCPLKRDHFSREYIFQASTFRGKLLAFRGVPFSRICSSFVWSRLATFKQQ